MPCRTRFPLPSTLTALLLATVAGCSGGSTPPGGNNATGQAIGAACTENSNCASGTCDTQLSGGYCTSMDCSACPSKSACGTAPGEYAQECLQTCLTNSECRLGYVCDNTQNACVPPSTSNNQDGGSSGTGTGVGASCTQDSDCASGSCITEETSSSFQGGYCSAECTSNSTCGADGACLAGPFENNSGQPIDICLLTCTSNSQCRDGYICTPVSGQDVCFPNDCRLDSSICNDAETCDSSNGRCSGQQTTPDAGQQTTPDAGQQTTPDAGQQSGPFVTVPLTGCPFLGFDAPVTIGGQTFELDVDTGSTTTFVAAKSCSNCGVTPEFTPSTSEITTTSSAYGSGSVNAAVYSENVQVGNEMPVVKMDFGAITSQSGFFLSESCDGTSNQQGEGIIGMGPINLDTIGTAADDAYFTDLVATAAGVKNIFALNLCSSNGNMWFGGYDTSFANGAPTYTAMTKASPPGESPDYYWEVSITSIGLGSTVFANSGDSVAVVDSGTGVFLMPANAYTALVKALASNSGADSIFGSGVLSSSFFSNGSCVAPTGGQSQADVDEALPPMTVTLPNKAGGSFTLTMPASQSYLALMEGEYCAAIESNSSSGGLTIWGAPSLRAYIEIFDVANQEIGFAPQSSCK